jgi:hypothetical protein
VSGDVVPLDALLIINDLNNRGARQLSAPTEGDSPPPYYDVSGDGWLTSLDALRVVNWLNANMSGESEAAVGMPNMFTSAEPVNSVTAPMPVDRHAAQEPPSPSPIEYNALDDYYTQATDQVLTLWFNRNSLELTELLREDSSVGIEELGLL